jgi:hypothetical protein
MRKANVSAAPASADAGLLKQVGKQGKNSDAGIRQSIFVAALVGGSVATSIAYFAATGETLLGLFTFTCLVAIWFAIWLYRSREARAEYRAWRKTQMAPGPGAQVANGKSHIACCACVVSDWRCHRDHRAVLICIGSTPTHETGAPSRLQCPLWVRS